MKIVGFRKSLGLTRKKVYEAMGISRSYYEKVEYGICKPGRGFIEKFHSAFPDADIVSIFYENRV